MDHAASPFGPEYFDRYYESKATRVHGRREIARLARGVTGMIAWLRVFRRPFFAQFGADEEQALSEVEQLLAPSLRDAKGDWTADYVRLRVEAVKP